MKPDESFNGTNFQVTGTGTVRVADNDAQGWKFQFTGGFPTPDEALDKLAAFQRAQDILGDSEGPPDAIRVLAAARAKELDVRVSFHRALEGGEVVWRVAVHTKRGQVAAEPRLSEKQAAEIAEDFIPVEAWKNALRDVGLL
jgi:hypothetical protein